MMRKADNMFCDVINTFTEKLSRISRHEPWSWAPQGRLHVIPILVNSKELQLRFSECLFISFSGIFCIGCGFYFEVHPPPLPSKLYLSTLFGKANFEKFLQFEIFYLKILFHGRRLKNKSSKLDPSLITNPLPKISWHYNFWRMQKSSFC